MKTVYRGSELVRSPRRVVRQAVGGRGPPPGGEPQGLLPEKVKYPGVGEASIVKPVHNYSFKLYV